MQRLRAMVERVLRVNRLHSGVIRLGWLFSERSLVPFALCEAQRPVPEGVVLQLVHVDGPPMGRYAKSAHQLRWESFRHQAQAAGVFDVLVIRRGWITETARFSVFLELDGCLCTPPATEVFGGVAREGLLADSGAVTREKPLTFSHLARASRIVLANSVRGAFDVAQVVDQAGRTVWRHPARRAKIAALPQRFTAA